MHICPGCDKSYKTEKGLKTHLLSKCEGIKEVFSLPAPVQKKKSKRGRPAKQMPGMDMLIANWDRLEIGEAYPLPDHEGDDSHPKVTLSRYHFRTRAEKVGLIPGEDFTIESHPDCGATITRKK